MYPSRLLRACVSAAAASVTLAAPSLADPAGRSAATGDHSTSQGDRRSAELQRPREKEPSAESEPAKHPSPGQSKQGGNEQVDGTEPVSRPATPATERGSRALTVKPQAVGHQPAATRGPHAAIVKPKPVGHRPATRSNATREHTTPSQTSRPGAHAPGRQRHAPSRNRSRAAGRHGAHGPKTTICHATGSQTNPFVPITIAWAALFAHAAHQHGEDIIPATQDCPAGSAGNDSLKPEQANGAAPGAAAAPSGSPAGTAAPDDRQIAGGRTPSPTDAVPVAGPSAGATAPPASPPRSAVLGERESGPGSVLADTNGDARPIDTAQTAELRTGAAPGTTAVAAARASSAEGDELPFTGSRLGLLVLIGMLAIGAGVAVRMVVGKS